MTNERIEAAAKVLAECMDYPWAQMPEQGRQSMREHAAKVIAAALAAPPAGISPAPLAGSEEMTDAQMLEAMQEQRDGAMALMFKERAQAVALREVLKQLLLEFGLQETFGIRLARAALSQGDVSGEGEGS